MQNGLYISDYDGRGKEGVVKEMFSFFGVQDGFGKEQVG